MGRGFTLGMCVLSTLLGIIKTYEGQFHWAAFEFAFAVWCGYDFWKLRQEQGK